MTEFGITKIMDGIFISDLSLPNDYQFLISNKVSHIILWTDSFDANGLQQSGIKTLWCQKIEPEGLLPPSSQLDKACDIIEESKQQCLCCLICSNILSEAAMILSFYLMKKFNWDLKTVFNFINLKFPDFDPRVEIVEQLQQIETQMQGNPLLLFPKSLEFNYNFLSSYQTDNDQERLLLNTIKNMALEKINCVQTKRHIPKRRKRVQWFDRLRPSTSLSSFNGKFAVYKRNSSLRPNKAITQKDDSKSRNYVNGQNKHIFQKRESDVVTYGQFFMDSLEFQSLKELTRCKTTQNRMMNPLRKSGSLRLLRPNKVSQQTKQNKQIAIQEIYSKSDSSLKKLSSQKNIFKNLNTINKFKLSLNA